jgi:hypothetical protein
MGPRRFAVVGALCGTVVLASWVAAARLAGLGSPGIANTGAPIEDRRATSVTSRAEHGEAPLATAMGEDAAVADMESLGAALPDPRAMPPAAPPPVLLASVSTAELIEDRRAASVTTRAEHVDAPLATAKGEDGVAVADMASGGAALPDPRPMLPAATPPVLLASVSTADPVQNDANAAARSAETLDECFVPEICIDEYLWSAYQRTPKVDTNKVSERIKVTVKKKGKTRTVIKTITKYVEADFTWKDPIAAQRAGMSLKEYVIGGMDRGFRLKLYRALRAMDDAGLMPGITSAFRDDYRQSIASGNKAVSDSSYHGGSRRGGYGRGLAADLVSLRGDTRMQRYLSSQELWKWIDAHEKELEIGRPYLNRDPPHVGPIDGREYADKRGRANVQKAGLQTKNAQTARLETMKRQLAVRNDSGPTKPAEPVKHPFSLVVR